MKKYEVAMKVFSQEAADKLILLLVHQGYAVYFNSENDNGDMVVCFEATSDEVTEIK